MAPPNFLLTSLARRAETDPESPFLFWQEGWIWRWWSWRETAWLVERWAVVLRAAGAQGPPGVRAAFAGDLHPQAVILDLAAQAAGLTPVPVTVGGGGAAAGLRASGAPACDLWLEVTTGGEARDWLPTVRRLGAEPATAAGPPGAARPVEPATEPGFMVAVADAVGAAGGRWRSVPEAELLRAAMEIDLAMVWPAASRREILVAGWPLGEPAARVLLAWATLSGAAVLLDADAARRPATVAWARPTVAYGDATELALLWQRVEPTRRRRRRSRGPAPARPRLPGGRLRVVFHPGDAPPAAAEAAAWLRQGVRLRPLPELGEG